MVFTIFNKIKQQPITTISIIREEYEGRQIGQFASTTTINKPSRGDRHIMKGLPSKHQHHQYLLA